MNKQQFLDKLKERLAILSETEVMDILDEYSDTIDQKIQEGMTEEDAVKDFGDINQLADEILEAYKINTNKSQAKSQDTAEQIGDILQQIVNYLEKFFTTLFKDLSVEKATRSLVLIGVAIVLIFFLQIPFAICRWLVSGLLRTLLPFGSIGQFLAVIVQIILSLAFLVLAILIVISFIRVGVNGEEITVDNLFKKPLKDGFKFDEYSKYEKKTETSSTTNFEEDIEAKIKAKYEKKFEKKYRSEPEVNYDKKPGGFGNFIISAIVWFLRFMAVIILLPLWMTIVALAITIGLLAYLWFNGVPLLGLVLITVGLLGLFNTVANVFAKLVFNKRQSLASVAWLLILSSILIGVGMPITFNDLADLNPIYVTTLESVQYQVAEEKFEETIPYTEDTFYDFGMYNVTFVYDEKLTDTIVVEGYGATFVSTHVIHNGTNTYRVYVTPEINSFKDVKLLIDTTLDALKDGNMFQFEDNEVELTIRIPMDENKEFKYYDKQGNIKIVQKVLK